MKNKITISLSEYYQLLDYKTNIEYFFDESECDKGRLIQDGFICPHCGSSDPINRCKGKSLEELIKFTKPS